MLRNDRAGRRALALLQLGAATAAERELFAASIDADPQYHRERCWRSPRRPRCPASSVRVGNANWDQRHNITGYDGAMYPLPPWQPAGGFSLDRALVCGFMRQESAFNPKARSYVGAMGLMQLMPRHRAARRPTSSHARDQAGAQSLRSAGQHRAGPGLHRLAAGRRRQQPGAHRGGLQWRAGQRHALGQFAERARPDPLLYIASIPLNETRDFVQRVLANYWMYQIRLGQPTPSLDQIAAHEWPRYTPQDTGAEGRSVIPLPRQQGRG